MRFVKMHGAGNDYIYVDARDVDSSGQATDWEDVARRVSDRHFGIGSDGLILLRGSDVADARMQMFNADGSEGMMCGNGIRCLVRFGLDVSALSSAKDAFRYRDRVRRAERATHMVRRRDDKSVGKHGDAAPKAL